MTGLTLHRNHKGAFEAAAAAATRSSARCRICGGPSQRVLSTRDREFPDEAREWNLVWCLACDYGWIDAELRPDEVGRFYPSDYYTHGEGGPENGPLGFPERLRLHLGWRLDRGDGGFDPSELSQAGRALDIGCGNGSNLAKLRDAGFEVLGLEPDDSAREVASRHATIHAGTAESADVEALGPGSFDVILMSHVLEHTIDPSKALDNTHRLLRPGGTLVIEVPNMRAVGFDMFGALWPWTDVPRHLHFFTETSLRRIVESAGFRVERVLYEGFTRQVSPSWVGDLERHWTRLHPGQTGPSFERKSWSLLARSILLPRDRKYDAIRIHAVRK